MLDKVIASNQDTGMSSTTLSRSDKAYLASTSDACWSCGAAATRPDGLCRDCGQIDGSAVPDIHDPKWAGNTKPMQAIFEAPPTAKRVR